MRIIFRDDVLTYINLVNETEDPLSEFQYSFTETSTITLKFEEKGYLQIVFENLDSIPVETSDLIEFLIDDILGRSEIITIKQFCDVIISKFTRGGIKVRIY